jgi:hypothetical protein
MVTADDVRAVCRPLPRSSEHLVHDRVKFRVGRIVFAAFSRDETVLGFGFPKPERAALVAARPQIFRLPRESDLRFNWVEAVAAELSPAEMAELIVDAWAMTVPKKVWSAYDPLRLRGAV